LIFLVITVEFALIIEDAWDCLSHTFL